MGAVGDPAPPDQQQEGLRARKRRQLRQRLSDTATGMFLERGFDAVRVSDVAAACEVSEKTVFNHFASKEALVMDRLEGVSSALRQALRTPGELPVDAVLRVLDGELDGFADQLLGPTPGTDETPATRSPVASGGSSGGAAAPGQIGARVGRYLRFGDVIRSTPSLQNHQARMVERFVAEVADALSERTAAPRPPEPAVPQDEEPADVPTGRHHDPAVQLGALVLVGLWRVQFDSLRHRLAQLTAPGEPDVDESAVAEAVRRVRADVARAARVARAALDQVEV